MILLLVVTSIGKFIIKSFNIINHLQSTNLSMHLNIKR